MRLRRISIALVACLFAASPAVAAEWWIILQRDGECNVHFGDVAQLRRDGDLVTFWTHLFYLREQDGMKSARIQQEVNCSNNQVRERRYIDFDSNRHTIDSGDNTAAEGWREVAPDTAGALYVQFACMAAEQRRARFLSVDENVDIFEVADFFLDPRPIVPISTSPS